MKKATPTRTALVLVLLGTVATPAAWACKAPVSPKAIPDGRTADMQVMLESARSVGQYNADVVDYFSCENNGLKLQEVSELQRVVMKRFTAEVRAFRSVHADAGASSARLARD